MILKNFNLWKRYLNCNMGAQTYNNSGIKNLSGSNLSLRSDGYNSNGSYYYITGDYAFDIPWLNNSRFFHVGTGTTEPTPNDFKLENNVTSSFTNLSSTCTINNVGDNGRREYTFTFVGKNNTSENITLTELGLGWNRICTGYQQYDSALWVRHLLDTPLTVKPNETFHITLVWTED